MADGGGSNIRRKAAGGWGKFCLWTKLRLQNRIHQITEKVVGFLGALHENRVKVSEKMFQQGTHARTKKASAPLVDGEMVRNRSTPKIDGDWFSKQLVSRAQLEARLQEGEK